jgi:hypothetical protein
VRRQRYQAADAVVRPLGPLMPLFWAAHETCCSNTSRLGISAEPGLSLRWQAALRAARSERRGFSLAAVNAQLRDFVAADGDLMVGCWSGVFVASRPLHAALHKRWLSCMLHADLHPGLPRCTMSATRSR